MKSTLVLLILCLSSLANAMSIIGANERTAVNDPELASKVGAIMYKGHPVCTAFASGKNQVTTAAGCVDVLELREYSFALVDKKLKPIIKATVKEKAGIAVLKVEGIDKFLPKEVMEDSDYHLEIISFGIESQTLLKANTGDLIIPPFEGLLFYTFDSEMGSSGAPILQNGKVVAIHLGNAVYKKTSSKGDKEDIVYNVAVKTNDLSKIDLGKFQISFEHLKQ